MNQGTDNVVVTTDLDNLKFVVSDEQTVQTVADSVSNGFLVQMEPGKDNEVM